MEYWNDWLEQHKWKLAAIVAVSSCLRLIKSKYLGGTPCPTSRHARLDKQTCIVTGANSGIGYETALEMARRGACVIMACRDTVDAASKAERIRRRTGNARVLVEHIDLASLSSVKAFATRVLTDHARVEILINNAGQMNCPQMRTEDNFEYQFQVNYLAHYLLTRLLMQRLVDSQPSRVINVTSKLYESRI